MIGHFALFPGVFSVHGDCNVLIFQNSSQSFDEKSRLKRCSYPCHFKVFVIATLTLQEIRKFISLFNT